MEQDEIIREIADILEFQSDNDIMYTAMLILLKLKKLGVINEHG